KTLNPGIVISVSIDMVKSAEKPGSIFLPITAVNVGQNESYVYVYDNGVAKKQLVEVVAVSGENVEVSAKTELAPETMLIISGGRLIKDGDQVVLKNSNQSSTENK
ncbi:MAG: hypothetical protein Q7T50_00430, partial [Candidatus Magasanikbacteria bacterium]|nr:hypothetical protein [Candidatus Magasanikbacteria bacterium]